MYTASDLKKGLKIEIDGEPYEITEFSFSKPGKGQSIYRCRVKNLAMGNTHEVAYRSADKIEKADLSQRPMIFSYVEGDHYVFIEPSSYEQLLVDAKVIGDRKYFLIEDMEVELLFHNDRVIDISLPNFIEKKIIDTEPGARGDTATNVLKPAKVDNGYEVQVPIFVNAGDIIRIDTRTGTYNGRV